MAVDVIRRCRATDDLDLTEHDPAETFGWDKEWAKTELDRVMGEVDRLQARMFAGEDAALLVVLQAMDAGGKDGTIRTVMRYLNPAGVDVNAFGVPSEEERSHDYLWRVHHHTPPKGTIGVFNRSHYEDVLVVRVKGLVPDDVWRRRYRHIREFERMLADEGTHVVKLFLNISAEEQRERMQDRIDDPEERWKFRSGDLDDRALWPEYMRAFRDALRETSTDAAPWYVVPADRKWVRNLVVAQILLHHLSVIDPELPAPEPGIDGTIVV
jgi:PPK2 family polyphosphate:nucleotide phosphotransferase